MGAWNQRRHLLCVYCHICGDQSEKGNRHYLVRVLNAGVYVIVFLPLLFVCPFAVRGFFFHLILLLGPSAVIPWQRLTICQHSSRSMHNGEIEAQDFQFPSLYHVNGLVICLEEFYWSAAICYPGKFLSEKKSLEIQHRPTSCWRFAYKRVTQQRCQSPLWYEHYMSQSQSSHGRLEYTDAFFEFSVQCRFFFIQASCLQ